LNAKEEKHAPNAWHCGTDIFNLEDKIVIIAPYKTNFVVRFTVQKNAYFINKTV
jgi:hypothetical protein